MKKIGILGGTFNPIHFGHLILGQSAKEEFGLDKVLVMPTKNPAYKTISGGVTEQNRIDMIQLAIQDFPYFEFSDVELRRDGATYTVDTLKELMNQNNFIKINERDMYDDGYYGRTFNFRYVKDFEI